MHAHLALSMGKFDMFDAQMHADLAHLMRQCMQAWHISCASACRFGTFDASMYADLALGTLDAQMHADLAPLKDKCMQIWQS